MLLLPPKRKKKIAARTATTPTTEGQENCYEASLGSTMDHRREETQSRSVLQPARYPFETGGSSNIPELHKVETAAFR